MTAKWKELLANVAPMIGGALGGNMGETAVSMAMSALGLPAGSTEDDLAQAVAIMTPEQSIELKKADIAFNIRKEELYVELERDKHGDRANAREMHIKSDKSDRNFNKFIIIMDSALCAAAMAGLFFYGEDIPDKVEGVLYMTIGILFTVFKTERHFIFGSSAGSKAKTEALSERH